MEREVEVLSRSDAEHLDARSSLEAQVLILERERARERQRERARERE